MNVGKCLPVHRQGASYGASVCVYACERLAADDAWCSAAVVHVSVDVPFNVGVLHTLKSRRDEVKAGHELYEPGAGLKGGCEAACRCSR